MIKKIVNYTCFFTALVIPFYASGTVTLNEKWIMSGGLYSLSISPKGTVRDRYPEQKNFKCTSGAGYDTCESYWQITIMKGAHPMIYTCASTAIVNKGATLDSLASRIDNNLMTPCATTYYAFTGNEEVCVKIYTFGSFSGDTSFPPQFASYGSCPGGGGSGTIEPPVKPVTCQIKNQDIVIQHPAVSQDKLDGNYKETTFDVSCTRKSSVRLTVSGLDASSRLALSGAKGLYSKLKINNNLAGAGVTINDVGDDGSKVSLSSELQSIGEVQGGNIVQRQY